MHTAGIFEIRMNAGRGLEGKARGAKLKLSKGSARHYCVTFLFDEVAFH
jgi:hypothetical protein